MRYDTSAQPPKRVLLCSTKLTDLKAYIALMEKEARNYHGVGRLTQNMNMTVNISISENHIGYFDLEAMSIDHYSRPAGPRNWE